MRNQTNHIYLKTLGNCPMDMQRQHSEPHVRVHAPYDAPARDRRPQA